MDWIGFSYALFVSAGGVIGYAKADRLFLKPCLKQLLKTCHRIREMRHPSVDHLLQCHLSGRRSPVRPVGCCRGLSGVSESQERVAFSGHRGNFGCGDGTEVSGLPEVHAGWFNDFSECADAGEDHRWNAEVETTQILNSFKL
ncbi:hypothetical protein GOODEAATRI_025204 [Goodea atripinnis]|uniref:Uncharacterized protein n=1 Tax=Goodea atripinnis TaxID=208336 RepID=A0ABV0MKL9_9TELE